MALEIAREIEITESKLRRGINRNDNARVNIIGYVDKDSIEIVTKQSEEGERQYVKNTMYLMKRERKQNYYLISFDDKVVRLMREILYTNKGT